MCLIVFAYKTHPAYHLIMGANRDEYYARPTEAAHFWQSDRSMLAGRDLQGGGTWLGITKQGRLAAITNYRDPSAIKAQAPSRGGLVKNFLTGSQSPEAYLTHIHAKGHVYNGFNLLAGDDKTVYYYSNQSGEIKQLQPGIYGLSNHLLNTPWPKVKNVIQRFKRLNDTHRIDARDIFDILSDTAKAPDEQLPQTGVSLEWERLLSSIFIKSDDYGTRCSTVVLVKKDGMTSFVERTHDSPPKTVTYDFQLKHLLKNKINNAK